MQTIATAAPSAARVNPITRPWGRFQRALQFYGRGLVEAIAVAMAPEAKDLGLTPISWLKGWFNMARPNLTVISCTGDLPPRLQPASSRLMGLSAESLAPRALARRSRPSPYHGRRSSACEPSPKPTAEEGDADQPSAPDGQVDTGQLESCPTARPPSRTEHESHEAIRVKLFQHILGATGAIRLVDPPVPERRQQRP
jgi:hypothetical protein